MKNKVTSNIRTDHPAFYGKCRTVIIADTATHIGPFHRLHALTDAVISDAELQENVTGALSGVTIKAMDDVMLSVNSIKLTSGTLIAYGEE